MDKTSNAPRKMLRLKREDADETTSTIPAQTLTSTMRVEEPAQPLSVQSKFSVAVVGLSGVGKTILTAVMAKRFGLLSGQVYYLDPEDRETGVHVETIWDTLNNKCDWPDSTVNGTFVDLKWKLVSRARDEALCDVRVIDCSGQDLGKIFGSENVKASDASGEYFDMLRSYCLNADIIVYIVNLEDALGHGDSLRRINNDLTIRAILKHVGTRGGTKKKSMCLVLSQVDKYRELEKKHDSWDEVIARSFPHTFSQLATESDVPILPVAAIKDTVVVPDKDGIPRRAPRREFESEGLLELLTWIATKVESTMDEQRREIERLEEIEDLREFKRQTAKNNKAVAIGLIAGTGILILILLIGIIIANF